MLYDVRSVECSLVVTTAVSRPQYVTVTSRRHFVRIFLPFPVDLPSLSFQTVLRPSRSRRRALLRACWPPRPASRETGAPGARSAAAPWPEPQLPSYPGHHAVWPPTLTSSVTSSTATPPTARNPRVLNSLPWRPSLWQQQQQQVHIDCYDLRTKIFFVAGHSQTLSQSRLTLHSLTLYSYLEVTYSHIIYGSRHVHCIRIERPTKVYYS